ncbi:hypothetical protein [Vulcanisaeta moutnovskia]|uniref:hypothetical protein n=1 Tax=Vulcanisaeta moutnovskia TaxID=985052 RepID=UPI00192C692D|nr:hypothetical protein [Vulcanisaeta moutnovskia]
MKNTDLVAKMARERPDPPLPVVSILLVPSYIDAEKVRGLLVTYHRWLVSMMLIYPLCYWHFTQTI